MRAVLYLILHPGRLLTFLGALLGLVAYVWIAAVRAVPAVRARKAEARAWRRALGGHRERGSGHG
jgi:hypothetical protein